MIDLLKDRSIDPNVFNSLRKMKPMRQIEAVELMTAVGNFAPMRKGRTPQLQAESRLPMLCMIVRLQQVQTCMTASLYTYP